MADRIPSQVFLAGLILAIILYSICYLLFFLRRKMFPIAQRHPYVVLAEMFFLIGLGTVINMSDAFPNDRRFEDCAGFILSLNFFFYGSLLMIVNRLLWLWHKDFTTKVMLKYQSSMIGRFSADGLEAVNEANGDEVQAEDERITQYLPKQIESKMISNLRKFNSKVLLFFNSLWILGFAAWDYTVVASRKGEVAAYFLHDVGCHPLWKDSCTIKIIFLGIVSVILFFLIIPLLKQKDNLGVAKEMRFLILFCVGCAVAYAIILIDAWEQVIFAQTRVWGFIISLLLIPICIGFQGYYMVYLTMKNDKFGGVNKQSFLMAGVLQAHAARQRVSSGGSTLNLPRGSTNPGLDVEEFNFMLKDPTAKKLLQAFMQSEFSVENLLFHEACLNYSKSYPKYVEGKSDAAVKIAVSIRDYFLKDTATYTINIPSAMRRDLIAKIDELIPESADLRSVISKAQKSLNSTAKPRQPSDAPDPESSAGGQPRTSSPEKVKLPEDLFKEVQEEVFSLMFRDTYSRFKLTPQWKEFAANSELKAQAQVV